MIYLQKPLNQKPEIILINHYYNESLLFRKILLGQRGKSAVSPFQQTITQVFIGSSSYGQWQKFILIYNFCSQSCVASLDP